MSIDNSSGDQDVNMSDEQHSEMSSKNNQKMNL